MLIVFLMTYSISLPIAIMVVFITADDNDNPFTRFGTKGMLLRCCGFELVASLGAFIATAILVAARSPAGLGAALAFVLFWTGVKTLVAIPLFEREFADSLVLVIVVTIVNIGIFYGVPHLLLTSLL